MPIYPGIPMLNCGDRPCLDNSQSNATRETKTDVNRFVVRPITRVVANPLTAGVQKKNKNTHETSVVTWCPPGWRRLWRNRRSAPRQRTCPLVIPRGFARRSARCCQPAICWHLGACQHATLWPVRQVFPKGQRSQRNLANRDQTLCQQVFYG